MHKRWLCQIDVGLRLEATGPLLVKSGAASMVGADMSPVLTYRNGEPEPYLPGSSLKGVLRSHIERIARSLRSGSVCLPYVDRMEALADVPPEVRGAHGFVGCGHQLHERTESTADWYRLSCAACRTFGSTKVAGRLSIADAYATPPDAQGRKSFAFETHDGVAIDRFTGGAARGLKFELEVVAAGSTFDTTIRLESFELWQVAALHVLLDDLADEVIRVGSGRSRGLGAVKGTVTSFRVSYARPRRLLDGVAEILGDDPASRAELEAYGLLTDLSTVGRRPELPPAERRGVRLVHDLGREGWRAHTQAVAPLLAAYIGRESWSEKMREFVASRTKGAGARR